MDQDQLHDLENLCIQECAPECTAACPLHVDARAVCSAIQEGDFSKGLQILRKTMPFPGIISRVCEQPCRNTCLRNEAIIMADLERACVDFGVMEEKSSQLIPRKQRVAIIGGGMNGLTAAHDLAKKRYSVVVFEASGTVGGRLCELPESRLPRGVFEKDIELLIRMGVEFRLNSTVNVMTGTGGISLSALQHEFDAVYLATGSNTGGNNAFNLTEAGLGEPDPVTRATTQPGIFAAADIGKPKDSVSIIMTMSDGRRAATSIDRYIQRVSLTATRINEGPYDSCLYTNTEGVPVMPAIKAGTGGYSKEEAMLEAGRCLKCECMECVKQCEYLSSYGEYPKKYARSIYNNLSIVMGTRLANKLINSCSLCGQCEEICPNDFSMAKLCKEARQTMVIQKHMPPSAHDFALSDMQFSNSEKFAVTKNPPGKDTSTYVFFPGCQLSASTPDQVEKVYGYLRTHLDSVGLMLRCCGAPADWAGRQDLFTAAQAEFKSQYDTLGNPTVIMACPSCYQVFKTSMPDLPIISLWEMIERCGLPEGIKKNPNRVVSIHDPCSTRHEPHIHESVRRLAHEAGIRVEELPLNREKTSCCSYGGEVWLANRELSDKIIERRVAESPNDFLTYCAMCRDFFVSKGKPTLHLLDLFFDNDPSARAAQHGPDYSQRHENRARLKQKLLNDLWNEKMPDQKNYESIQLFISEEIQQKLDDRLILIEDIQQVIEYAEKTGYRLVQPGNGRLLAHYKPTRVTYWVEYAPKDGGFEIFNAYSHRMEITEDLKS